MLVSFQSLSGLLRPSHFFAGDPIEKTASACPAVIVPAERGQVTPSRREFSHEIQKKKRVSGTKTFQVTTDFPEIPMISFGRKNQVAGRGGEHLISG